MSINFASAIRALPLSLAKTPSPLILLDLRRIAIQRHGHAMIPVCGYGVHDDGCLTPTRGSRSDVVDLAGQLGSRESGSTPPADGSEPLGQTPEVLLARSPLLGRALSALEGMAVISACGSTGHGGQMAPRRIQTVLAMAVTIQATGSAGSGKSDRPRSGNSGRIPERRTP